MCSRYAREDERSARLTELVSISIVSRLTRTQLRIEAKSEALFRWYVDERQSRLHTPSGHLMHVKLCECAEQAGGHDDTHSGLSERVQQLRDRQSSTLMQNRELSESWPCEHSDTHLPLFVSRIDEHVTHWVELLFNIQTFDNKLVNKNSY